MHKFRLISLILILVLSSLNLGTNPAKAFPDSLTLRPNASGTYQQWSLTDSTHWGATSDQSDTTYVYVTDSTSLKETENLADTSQTGIINSVTAYMRAKVSAGSFADEQAVIVWRTYGTDYESSATTISRTAFTDYSQQRTVNPNTGLAWTWTEVNALEIGSRASTLGNTITFVAAGAKAAGTGSVTPALPTGIAANDIAILTATTIAGGTVTITSSGSITTWTALTGSPIDVTGGEKLYVWWGRYSSGSTGPTVSPGSDHICAGIAAWRGIVTSGSPIDVSATGTETTSDTSLSFATGISTTVDNTMVLLVSSTGADSNTAQHSSQANPNLSSVAEKVDYNTNSGGGGGFEVVEGYKATAGAVGTWTATLATASPKAYISFALKPQVETIQVSEYWIIVDYTAAQNYQFELNQPYSLNSLMTKQASLIFTLNAPFNLLESLSKELGHAFNLAAGLQVVSDLTKQFSIARSLSEPYQLSSALGKQVSMSRALDETYSVPTSLSRQIGISVALPSPFFLSESLSTSYGWTKTLNQPFDLLSDLAKHISKIVSFQQSYSLLAQLTAEIPTQYIFDLTQEYALVTSLQKQISLFIGLPTPYETLTSLYRILERNVGLGVPYSLATGLWKQTSLSFNLPETFSLIESFRKQVSLHFRFPEAYSLTGSLASEIPGQYVFNLAAKYELVMTLQKQISLTFILKSPFQAVGQLFSDLAAVTHYEWILRLAYQVQTSLSSIPISLPPLADPDQGAPFVFITPHLLFRGQTLLKIDWLRFLVLDRISLVVSLDVAGMGVEPPLDVPFDLALNYRLSGDRVDTQGTRTVKIDPTQPVRIEVPLEVPVFSQLTALYRDSSYRLLLHVSYGTEQLIEREFSSVITVDSSFAILKLSVVALIVSVASVITIAYIRQKKAGRQPSVVKTRWFT